MVLTLIDTSQINEFTTTFIGLGRNRTINGEMRIDQANAGAARTYNDTSFPPSVDMWKGSATAASGAFTLQRSTSTPPTGFTNFLRATCTVADVSITANDGYLVHSYIEGNNVRDFLTGTANAKTVTLSFWIRSSLTGIYGVAFSNGAFDRSYVAEYTINAANTWEFKTVTLIMDTTGTWLTDTGVGLALRWTLAAGSSSQTTAGVWTAGNLVTTANQVNFMSSNSSRTWDITGVQIEIGSTATGFEYRLFQIELMLCKRYYEKSYDLDTAPATAIGAGIRNISNYPFGTNISRSASIFYEFRKRVTPILTIYSFNGTPGTADYLLATRTTANRAVTVTDNLTNGFTFEQSVAAADNLGAQFHYVSDARL